MNHYCFSSCFFTGTQTGSRTRLEKNLLDDFLTLSTLLFLMRENTDDDTTANVSKGRVRKEWLKPE